MNDHQTNTLFEKKKQLKLKLGVKNTIQHNLLDWLPGLDYLQQHKLPYRLIRLALIDADELPYWEAELREEKLARYGFSTKDLLITDEDTIGKNVIQAFPNTNPLRYVPDLPLKSFHSSDWKGELARAASELGMNNAEVIFFYWKYSPVLSLNMDVLLSMDEDPADIMPQDMVICTHDYRRMICRTLEEDWYWGEAG